MNNRTEGTSAIAHVEVRVFRAPIETPVRTSFGVMADRPAVLVRVEDTDGAFGWGEIWCNFPTCGAEHRARLVETVIAPLLIGYRFERPADVMSMLARRLRILRLQTREFGPIDQAIAGIDVAIWDLAARRAGVPLWRYMGGTRSRVPAYASGINPELALGRIEQARAAGLNAFKVKIGFDEAEDVRVVAEVAAALFPDEHLMLDANQAWTPDVAKRMAARLAAFPIDWLEEPMPVDTPDVDWQHLSAGVSPPLAGGENFASAEAFTGAIAQRTLSVIQPDICKWGGLSECLPIARAIRAAGLRYCPHYLGAGVGLVASAHLLAAVGGDGLLEIDCNPNPLREMLAQPYPDVVDGMFDLGTAAGLGVQPALDDVAAWQVLRAECH